MRSPLAFSMFLALVGLAAPACKSQGSAYSGVQNCYVDAPCDTDPSKTCKVPCKPGMSGGGHGNGGSGGGDTTGGGAGGGGPVDVLGSIVVFTDDAFVTTVPYAGDVHVVAPGVDTQTVEADTLNGDFELKAAASGGQWVLAQSSGASDAPFSTYTFQDLDGVSGLVLPMVPVTALDDIAVQLDVPSFGVDRAQIVLYITDESGAALPGVSVGPLSGATFGYEIGSGEYVLNPAETSDLGIAVAFNVSVAAEATVDVPFTYDNATHKFALRLAPDTVTFAEIPIPTP